MKRYTVNTTKFMTHTIGCSYFLYFRNAYSLWSSAINRKYSWLADILRYLFRFGVLLPRFYLYRIPRFSLVCWWTNIRSLFTLGDVWKWNHLCLKTLWINILSFGPAIEGSWKYPSACRRQCVLAIVKPVSIACVHYSSYDATVALLYISETCVSESVCTNRVWAPQ